MKANKTNRNRNNKEQTLSIVVMSIVQKLFEVIGTVGTESEADSNIRLENNHQLNKIVRG